MQDNLSGAFDEEEYMHFIMQHNDGERVITNGDDLIGLVESGYLEKDFAEFVASREGFLNG